MRRSSGTVRSQGARVPSGRLLGLGNRLGRSVLPERAEELPVRRRRPVAERAAEAMQEHDRPTWVKRGRVAPQPQRMTEPDRRGRERVERLP